MYTETQSPCMYMWYKTRFKYNYTYYNWGWSMSFSVWIDVGFLRKIFAVPVHLKHVCQDTALFSWGPDAVCVVVCRLPPTHSLQVSSTPGSWWVRSWGEASPLLTTMYESSSSILNQTTPYDGETVGLDSPTSAILHTLCKIQVYPWLSMAGVCFCLD